MSHHISYRTLFLTLLALLALLTFFVTLRDRMWSKGFSAGAFLLGLLASDKFDGGIPYDALSS